MQQEYLNAPQTHFTVGKFILSTSYTNQPLRSHGLLRSANRIEKNIRLLNAGNTNIRSKVSNPCSVLILLKGYIESNPLTLSLAPTSAPHPTIRSKNVPASFLSAA